VLEQATVDLMTELDVGGRLRREGLVHHGIQLRFDGQTHRIDLHELTGGRSVTIYPQHKVLQDLIAARASQGGEILFDVEDVQLADVTARPVVRFKHAGERVDLSCDFVVGCDGSRSVARSYLPAERQRVFTRTYPFAWLGILMEAQRRPASSSTRITTAALRSSARVAGASASLRQCPAEDDIGSWSEEMIVDELRHRLATRMAGSS
jgi:p-hydroxybenzoate 3-monooxygenase